MADPTKRFSDRADVYAKYRPAYPPACIDFLTKQFLLTENSVVADIGSGTGLLSGLLIKKGCTVIGVEPNNDMRAQAEKELSNDRFVSVDGTAESTHINDSSVDLVTVAQAFHWMDAKKPQQNLIAFCATKIGLLSYGTYNRTKMDLAKNTKPSK